MLPFFPKKTAGCKPSPANTALSRDWAQHEGFLVLCLSSEQCRLDVLPFLSALGHTGSSGGLLRGR